MVRSTYNLFLISTLLVSMVLCIRCSSDDSSIPKVKLKPSGEEGEILLSSLFDSIIVIPLETSENSLLGSIRYVGFCNEKIIVSDRAAGIKVFDIKGQYLNSIGSPGSGPGEFGMAGVNIYADGKENILYINNTSKRTLMKFDIGGEFLGTIPIPEHYGVFYISPDSQITLVSTFAQIFTKSYFDVLKLSPTGDTLLLLQNSDLLSRTKPLEISKLPTRSFEHNGKLYLKRILNDTLYVESEGTFIPVLVFDHEGDGIGYMDAYLNNTEDFNRFLIISDLLIIRDELLVNYNFEGSQYWVRYNLTDGRTSYQKAGVSFQLPGAPFADTFFGIKNDIQPNLGNHNIKMSNGVYFSILKWEDTVTFNEIEKNKVYLKSENDNPAIIIYR